MALGPYRTSGPLVSAIVETEVGFDLAPFIAIANQITTDICGPSITGVDSQGHVVPIDLSYTDGFVNSKMELIERWLGAHFYQMFDAGLEAAKAGSVGAKFQVKVGYGLKLTVYGQMAILLDTALSLAKQDNIAQTIRRIRVGGDWLGDPNFGRKGLFNDWFLLVA